MSHSINAANYVEKLEMLLNTVLSKRLQTPEYCKRFSPHHDSTLWNLKLFWCANWNAGKLRSQQIYLFTTTIIKSSYPADLSIMRTEISDQRRMSGWLEDVDGSIKWTGQQNAERTYYTTHVLCVTNVIFLHSHNHTASSQNTNTNTNTTVISIAPPTVWPMAHYRSQLTRVSQP